MLVHCANTHTYLQHPVDGGLRPTVRRFAVNAVGLAFIDGDGLGRFILEIVELGLPYEDRVRSRGSPLVRGIALVLT